MSIKSPRFLGAAAVLIASALLGVMLVQRPKPPATDAMGKDHKDAKPADGKAPTAPPTVTLPADLNRMFMEADKAFWDKDYFTGITKTQDLLKALGPGKDAPYELLYFYIGLGNLLAYNLPEAEEAFKDCIKRFPQGEYASCCYFGLGRALMQEESKSKKEESLGALRKAAEDPRFSTEAGFWLASVCMELSRHEEALKILNSLMDSDVRTPQQTRAALEAIRVLADGKLVNFAAYLARISHQPAVRDTIAGFSNQVIAYGDEMIANENYEPALVVYRSVQPRSQILAIQNAALVTMRENQKILAERVAAEPAKPLPQHTLAGELLSPLSKLWASSYWDRMPNTPVRQLLNALNQDIKRAENSLKYIEGKPDLDASILMRRGRCLFYLKRNEEALTCFHALRERYPASSDAESAAYGEIVILADRHDMEGIKDKCDMFMSKYPNSEHFEEVAKLVGEALVRSGKWPEVGNFYRGLEAKFPQSKNMESYVFYQAVSFFQQALFKDSTPLFEKFLKNYPDSDFVETASYYVAMSYFISNDYKKTLEACRNYLTKYPNGRYAGDMQYRHSFIDFSDKDTDQNDKIISDLGTFLKDHPDDLAKGPILCLMGDTYRKKMEKAKTDDEVKALEKLALDCYDQAVWTESPDDVVQYALDTATSILQGQKDWHAIAELHAKFLKTKPQSPLALLSATWVAKAFAREGRSAEAVGLLAAALKARIADPSSDQVELLIDELVNSIVPHKKAAEIDLNAIDKQLTDLLNKTVAGIENATTAARISYARARLAEMVKRMDLSDIYLKDIALSNAGDPTGLSAALLSVCGGILLKQGDLDGAEKMFKLLIDRHRELMFLDAGPVGLGYIALARKKPDEALKRFEDALKKPNNRRIKEATLGKLLALVDLNQLGEAEKLALNMVGNKLFCGETRAKVYLQLAGVYRKQADKAQGDDVNALLRKAHEIYQRIYVAYQGQPELCAEAYWSDSEVLKELGETKQSKDTLNALIDHPKLKNTEFRKRALEAK